MDDIIGLLSSISGLSMENMTRGHGWNFQNLGRRIERSLHLCNLIHSTLVHSGKERESLHWLLLQCADSLITYRRRYFTSIHSKPVIDLLVCDPLNPRSLAFQAEQIRQHIASLPHHLEGNLSQPIDRHRAPDQQLDRALGPGGSRSQGSARQSSRARASSSTA